MATAPGPDYEKERYVNPVASSESGLAPVGIGAQQELPPIIQNPLRIAEMAIEIQLERLRVAELVNARDALVCKLSDAHISIREKTDLIERLQKVLNLVMRNYKGSLNGEPASPGSQRTAGVTDLRAEVTQLETLIQELRIHSKDVTGPPPQYEEEERTSTGCEAKSTMVVHERQTASAATSPVICSAHVFPTISRVERSVQTPVPGTPDEIAATRFALLESIPLPNDPPDDTLKPITLPPTCTLHDFLNFVPGNLRNTLGNYRVLQSVTTKWCPNREEHGYFYTPLFKCNTNPRVNTAHRWQFIDIAARMKHPTECFYNRGGLWYYAGSYQALQLEDLTVKEWAELPPETSNYLVKETIAGRKNVSPQNIYEVSQLYSAGALKIACVGLQCVGFNQDIYQSILEQASTYYQAKWNTVAPTGSISVVHDANKTSTSTPSPKSPGTGAASENFNKLNGLVKSVSSGTPPAIHSAHLGSANAGYGVVAVGLGLGNCAARNATLLAQANNSVKAPHNGTKT